MHVILTPHYPPRRYGGVEKVVQQLARGLRDAGERVVVGALSLDEQSAIDDDAGIPIVRVSCQAATKEARTATILDAQDALVEAVLPFIDDDAVVHAHDWFVAPAAIALRDRLGARLVAFIHSVKRAEVDTLHERHQRIHDLQCLLAREARAVLAATAVSRRTIETHLGVPQPA